MNLIKVTCVTCSKTFSRSKGRINEAKKFGWKQFCSAKCLARSKMNGQMLVCINPKCRKRFYRAFRDINKEGRNFCSRSCAVKINNSRYPKRKAPIKNCLYCGRTFKATGRRAYCSRKCKDSAQVISKNEILAKIKEFYKREGRIPFKEEFPHYNAAQERFGTWNKAIEAAGFEPNPVIFSKKFIAKDGHICDSFAEKIIDDWLYDRRIKHIRSVPYPKNKKLTVDFVTKNNWIEFWGLKGVIKRYDELVKQKRRLCRKYNLSLIELYPKDLFPINHLSEIIRIKNG